MFLPFFSKKIQRKDFNSMLNGTYMDGWVTDYLGMSEKIGKFATIYSNYLQISKVHFTWSTNSGVTQAPTDAAWREPARSGVPMA